MSARPCARRQQGNRLRKILYRVEVGYCISTLRQNASDQLFLLGIDETSLGVGLQREEAPESGHGI
jgi:hypothetical protein